MDIFGKINALEILTVLDTFGIRYTKDSWVPHTYTILKDNWTKDNSFKVNSAKNIAVDFWGDGIKWWPFDLIARLVLGVDPQTNVGKVATIKAFVDRWLVSNPQTKKEFIKSLSWEELFKDFDNHKIGWYSNDVCSFLLTRGFTHEWIQKNKLRVWEVFANIWYYDNYFTTEKPTWQDEDWNWQNHEGDKPKTVGVFIFPCYNEHWDLIWIKLRRKDGKMIRGKKSPALSWLKTWLLYDNLDLDSMIIVEGETDYLVLKLLWYTNVVWNLWGVQGCRPMLKSLLSETNNIICLYDNDVPWHDWLIALQKTFKRVIKTIEYPIRLSNTWKELKDVNDYYSIWYDTKAKWDTLLKWAKDLWENEKDKIEHKTDFIFLRSTLEYYDIKYKKIQKEASVATFLWATKKELYNKVNTWQIKQYEDLCYLEWGQEWYFNTLNEWVILKNFWDVDAVLHPHIKYLIENIWWNKPWNIEWIHKSILYKLTHINDPYLPALILYWPGSSWKWTLLNLLSKIFWEENLQTWLWQKDLEWNFDSYQGNKLIVEYKEISSWNKFQDKKVTDKIKSIINESTISVRALYQNARKVKNIARFHFSSNHAIPIQLDSSHSGNRRFSIIKTWASLDTNLAKEMNEVTFKNELIIKQYISRLYETFPDIPKLTHLDALDNNEKKDLERNCEGAWNLFFEWFEREYPYIEKITNTEKNKLLKMYCIVNWEDFDDIKYNQKNFDNWLSHRYEKKNISIRGKTCFWYKILKTDYDREHIPAEARDTFKEWEVNNFLL